MATKNISEQLLDLRVKLPNHFYSKMKKFIDLGTIVSDDLLKNCSLPKHLNTHFTAKNAEVKTSYLIFPYCSIDFLSLISRFCYLELQGLAKLTDHGQHVLIEKR